MAKEIYAKMATAELLGLSKSGKLSDDCGGLGAEAGQHFYTRTL